MDSRRGNRGFGQRPYGYDYEGGRGHGHQQNFERPASKPPAFGYRGQSSFTSSNPQMRSSNRRKTHGHSNAMATGHGNMMVTGQVAYSQCVPQICRIDSCSPNMMPDMNVGGDWQPQCTMPAYVGHPTEWCNYQNPHCVPAECKPPTRISPPPALRVAASPVYPQDASFVPYPPAMYGPAWTAPQPQPMFMPPHWNVPQYSTQACNTSMVQQWQCDGVTYYNTSAPVYYPAPQYNAGPQVTVIPNNMGGLAVARNMDMPNSMVGPAVASNMDMPNNMVGLAVASNMDMPHNMVGLAVANNMDMPNNMVGLAVANNVDMPNSMVGPAVASNMDMPNNMVGLAVANNMDMPNNMVGLAVANNVDMPNNMVGDQAVILSNMGGSQASEGVIYSNIESVEGPQANNASVEGPQPGSVENALEPALVASNVAVVSLMPLSEGTVSETQPHSVAEMPCHQEATLTGSVRHQVESNGLVTVLHQQVPHTNGDAALQVVSAEPCCQTESRTDNLNMLELFEAISQDIQQPRKVGGCPHWNGGACHHPAQQPGSGSSEAPKSLTEMFSKKQPSRGHNKNKSKSGEKSQGTVQQDRKVGWDENTQAMPQQNRVPYFLQPQPGEDAPQPVILDFKELFANSERLRLEKLAAMTPIIKDTYVENEQVATMSHEEAESFRAMKNGIKVHYIDVAELIPSFLVRTNAPPTDSTPKLPIPNPIRTFEEGFSMYPEIMGEIAKQGFTEPSPIQSQLWPCAMKGMDVVGIAQTGSGKTLAFLLPAMIHIERQITPREQRNSPTVLVLAPTRELAQQIDREVKKYSYKNIRSVCLYGGGSRGEQIDALSIQTEIVIATPGRLNDLVQAKMLDLSEVSFLVLDEADEMLDSGFEPQINKALLHVRGDRQTVLTSATWPESVRRMAKNYTTDPVMVVVGTTDIRAVTSVKQNIIFLDSQDDRFVWIVDFLRNMSKEEKAIIFVGKKSLADHLSSELALMSITVQTIHGSMCQEDREQAISDMQCGNANILVATDVASRGIDIENINHVINHQFPNSVEQYVHRIGRTGRAGKLGESHTFIGRKDWSSAKQLIEILQFAEQEVPQELRDMAQRFENRRPSEGRGRGGRGRGRGGYDRQLDGFFSSGRDFSHGRDRYESQSRTRETVESSPEVVFDWGGNPPKIISEGTDWVEESPVVQAMQWSGASGGEERNQRSGGGQGWDQMSGNAERNQSSAGACGQDEGRGWNQRDHPARHWNSGEQGYRGNWQRHSGSRGGGEEWGSGQGNRGNWERNSGNRGRGEEWGSGQGNRGCWERGGEGHDRGRARNQGERYSGNQGCRYTN